MREDIGESAIENPIAGTPSLAREQCAATLLLGRQHA